MSNQMRAAVLSAIERALVAFDTSELAKVLDPHVIWGDCSGAENVLTMLQQLGDTDVEITDHQIEALDDRIVATVKATTGGHSFPSTTVVFVEDDLIVELHSADSEEHARSLVRVGPFTASDFSTRAKLIGLEPVLPVSDMTAAIVHYKMLGFEVETYPGGDFYAFANRDGIEVHLARYDGVDPKTTTSAIYLHVDDARSLFTEWRDAGLGVRQGALIAPTDTDYGICEGAHRDPWGNLLRFGSPIT